MNREEEMLVQALHTTDGLDEEMRLELDDECAGEDTAMEIELLESRVRAARLAGA